MFRDRREIGGARAVEIVEEHARIDAETVGDTGDLVEDLGMERLRRAMLRGDEIAHIGAGEGGRRLLQAMRDRMAHMVDQIRA